MKRYRSLVIAGAAVLGAVFLMTGTASPAPAGAALVAFHPHPHHGIDRGDRDDRPGGDDRRGDDRFGEDRGRGGDDRFGGNDDDADDPTATGPDTARGIGSEMRQEWSADPGDAFPTPSPTDRPTGRPTFGP